MSAVAQLQLPAGMDGHRRRLLEQAVLEAARAIMAAQLRFERARGTPREVEHELVLADAWQTLRDCCFAERTARGGRP